MFNTSQKVKSKRVIKDPIKLRQIAAWKKSDFNNASSSYHHKERTSFDITTEFLDNCINFHKDEIEAMLKKGIDIDSCDKDNLTALHQACINAKSELVEYLLSKNANINAVDKEGWTPLHIAASIGSLELAKYLIDYGARMDLANYDGDLPISIVDDKDYPELIVYLKKEMDKKNIDENYCRTLEKTVMLEDILKWKLSGHYKPPIDIINKSTPLHVASSKNYIDIIKELIPLLDTHQLNAQDSDGWTSLHAAAHWGNHEACMLLIKAGADVDIVTNANETVLDTVDPLLKDQLTDDINAIKLENMKSRDLLDQFSIRSDNSNKRRSSIVRQSVEWKKNTQSKDPMMEREIFSNAAQTTDISQISLIEEEIGKSPKLLKVSSTKEYPSIFENDHTLESHLSRVIEVDETKSQPTISVTSPSISDAKKEHEFVRPIDVSTHKFPAEVFSSSSNTPDGDTSSLINSPSREFNNGASCDISENSSYSSEVERTGARNTTVIIRPKRLSLVMAPSKCDESETLRREKARRVRSNRRSTQGISSDTVAAIKRRELEIISDGVGRKNSDIPEEDLMTKYNDKEKISETNVTDISVCKDDVFAKPTDINETKESIVSKEKSDLDCSGFSSSRRKPMLENKYSDNSIIENVNSPRSKLQHNNSINLPTQESVFSEENTNYDTPDSQTSGGNYSRYSSRPQLQHNSSLNLPSKTTGDFSKILPKREISKVLSSLIKSKQATDNKTSVNLQKSSSMYTNVSPSNQREVIKPVEKVVLDSTPQINKEIIEEVKESDCGSYVAKPMPGIRTKIYDTSDSMNVQLPSVSPPVKPQFNQQTYISKCTAISDRMSPEEIQNCKTLASRLANDQNIKIELQVEISELKNEIQQLKDNRDVVDAALKISRNTSGDRVFNLESELVKTKEENKKLKSQNEALLRVISKIQQDLEVFKDSVV